MFIPQLGIQLRKSFIFGFPQISLFLKTSHHFIFRLHLLSYILRDSLHLHFESLYTSIVLLEHHLITFILSSHGEDLPLQFGSTVVDLLIRGILLGLLLLAQEILLCLTLPLSLKPLLLFEFPLLTSGIVGSLARFSILLRTQSSLLILVVLQHTRLLCDILTRRRVAPGSRCRLGFSRLWPSRQVWLVHLLQIRRVLKRIISKIGF
jgi:hypothetical protein